MFLPFNKVHTEAEHIILNSEWPVDNLSEEIKN